jgi:hypothetical protein
MKKFRISLLLLGTFLMPVVSYGTVSEDDSGEAFRLEGTVVSQEALFEAIEANDINRVRYFLNHGVNANTYKVKEERYFDSRWSINYSSPLVEAIQKGNMAMVNVLLDGGADVNGFIEEVESGWSGEPYTHYLSPLVVAIRTRNIDMVRLLLERGANVNTKGGNVNVPLYEAVNNGSNITRLLLEQKGIDVNACQNVQMSYDDYEYAGYYGEDYHRQVPQTALENINEVGTGGSVVWEEIVKSLREKGTR